MRFFMHYYLPARTIYNNNLPPFWQESRRGLRNQFTNQLGSEYIQYIINRARTRIFDGEERIRKERLTLTWNIATSPPPSPAEQFKVMHERAAKGYDLINTDGVDYHLHVHVPVFPRLTPCRHWLENPIENSMKSRFAVQRTFLRPWKCQIRVIWYV